MRRWYALVMAVVTGVMIIVLAFIFAWARG
jgi:hypothetical protein